MSSSSDYKTYLAAAILTEDRVITYRLLSRALKVHVNSAKEMLYDFHQQQIAKKPGSLHATYLLGGIKREKSPATNGAHGKDGDDDFMQSSPFASSMPQPEEEADEPPVFSLTLVKEEHLDEARSSYEKITSIHVYSLGPHPLKMLSDANREIIANHGEDDPIEMARVYGTITNPYVRRRAVRRPPPAQPPPKATVKAESKSAPPPVKEELKAPTKPTGASDFFGKKSAAKNEATPSEKPAAKPKDAPSIFKAFAKAKPPAKASAVKEESTADSQDAEMKDASESEDDYVPPTQAPKTNVDADRKARKDREAALKKMMEDESEEETPPKVEEESTAASEDPGTSEPTPEASQEATAPARRRGRRRIMKKVTVKDEDGFLVTKEEPVWESFSEDEAPKAKPASGPSSRAGAGAGKKNVPAKTSQARNIMSFFGKK